MRSRVPLAAGGLVPYLALAALLIHSGPGPHYDEALFQAGAVHMLQSSGAPSFTHPSHGWLRAGGRHWPLMMMPYAGATSFYLLAPLFAIFGSGLLLGRVVAAVLGLLGLLGTGWLAHRAAGPAAAAAAITLLAVHPGYVSNTVFNDSGFAYWMAATAVVICALLRYTDRPTALRAGLLGLACGVGVWTRLNFAWLIAAALVGAAAGFGRQVLVPARHAAAAVAGGVVGSAPLIVYQLVSAGRGTLDYMAEFDATRWTAAHFGWRLRLLTSSLLYDDEHRWGMWEGPGLPAWQVAFVAAATAAGVLTAFVRGRDERAGGWHRATAAAVAVLAGLMVWTRAPVRGHHFVTVVPLAVVLIVVAACRVGARVSRSRPLLAVLAAVYVGMALYWDASAWRGIRATGGAGIWSDATLDVARYLDSRAGPRVRILDWGFDASLYVATEGRVRGRELFWQDPRGPESAVWRRELVPGGVYLTHAPAYLTPMGKPATERFRQALARSGLTWTTVVFKDRRGRPHSELVEISP